MEIANSNTKIREHEIVEHIAEPYTDVQVLTTEINSGVTDQIPIKNAEVYMTFVRQTKEGNDKIIRGSIELRMKFIESDNKLSSLTEELMKLKLENPDLEMQLNDIAMAFKAANGNKSSRVERQLCISNITLNDAASSKDKQHFRAGKKYNFKNTNNIRMQTSK